MNETMQQRRGRLVQEHLAPRMKAAGLRKSGTTWWEQRDGGWLVLELRGDRYNTKDRVNFWTSVEVWPAGTYEFFLLLYPQAGPRPHHGGTAPLWISRPLPGVPESEGLQDGWCIDASTDLVGLAPEVLTVMLAQVDWGRDRLTNLDLAVSEMSREDGKTWGLVNSVVALTHSLPDDRRLPLLVERLTRIWAADPRPIVLRPHLERWREQAGLDKADLPTFWSPCVYGRQDDGFSTPQARFRAGIGIHFSYPDGSESTVPPPGWLEQG
jgi:hypothetical protein